jgi:hypothetical protein
MKTMRKYQLVDSRNQILTIIEWLVIMFYRNLKPWQYFLFLFGYCHSVLFLKIQNVVLITSVADVKGKLFQFSWCEFIIHMYTKLHVYELHEKISKFINDAKFQPENRWRYSWSKKLLVGLNIFYCNYLQWDWAQVLKT